MVIEPGMEIKGAGSRIIPHIKRVITNPTDSTITFSFVGHPLTKAQLLDTFRAKLSNPFDTVLSRKELMLEIIPAWVKGSGYWDNALPVWAGIWADPISYSRQMDAIGLYYGITYIECGQFQKFAIELAASMQYFSREEFSIVTLGGHVVMEVPINNGSVLLDYDASMASFTQKSNTAKSGFCNALELYNDTSKIKAVWTGFNDLSFVRDISLENYKSIWAGLKPALATNSSWQSQENITGVFKIPAHTSFVAERQGPFFLVDLAQPEAQKAQSAIQSFGQAVENPACTPECKKQLIDSLVKLFGKVFPAEKESSLQSLIFDGGVMFYNSVTDQGKPIRFSRKGGPVPSWKVVMDTVRNDITVGTQFQMPGLLLEASNTCVIGEATIEGSAQFRLWDPSGSPTRLPGEVNYIQNGFLPKGQPYTFVVSMNDGTLSPTGTWTIAGEGANNLVITTDLGAP